MSQETLKCTHVLSTHNCRTVFCLLPCFARYDHLSSSGLADLSKTSTRQDRVTCLWSTSERTTKKLLRETRRSRKPCFRSWTRWRKSARLPPSFGGEAETLDWKPSFCASRRLRFVLFCYSCLLLLGADRRFCWKPSARYLVFIAPFLLSSLLLAAVRLAFLVLVPSRVDGPILSYHAYHSYCSSAGRSPRSTFRLVMLHTRISRSWRPSRREEPAAPERLLECFTATR